MKKILLPILLFPAVALAQDDWEYVAENSDSEPYFIRAVEKKSYGNKVTFWIKRVNADKNVKTKKGTIKKKGGHVIAKWECDCTEETIETKMIATYDNNGKIINSDSGPFFAEPAIPDTVGYKLLKTACNLEK